MERIIGTYEGEEKGVLFIVFGGMHGNEHSGVKAIKTFFKMLHDEPKRNPNFKFKGKMIGLAGNIQALENSIRYFKYDLNRQFTKENVERVLNTPSQKLDFEDIELKDIITTIQQEIKSYKPEKVVALDLHSTSSKGGIFSISTDDPDSIRIAKEMNAPVILGFMKGIKGTTLHYLTKENFNIDITTMVFEAGQHDDPQSEDRAIAAIAGCLRSIGCVMPEDIESKHDNIILDYANGLPTVSELIYTHSIDIKDDFKMYPGYSNFQKVTKGEILAEDNKGLILAPNDGMILMPLYQPKGSDGFFIIKKLEGY